MGIASYILLILKQICLELNFYISVTTLGVITPTSTAVTQTLTINNTNTIIVTASLLTTTSFNVITVLPTTTFTHSVSEDISTGFVYKPSSTEVTDTQYTAVLVLTTSVLATDADSSTAVVVRPTNVSNKTSSITSSTIWIIVAVTLGAILFILCLAIYFVVSNKKRRTKSHRFNQASQIGDVTLLSSCASHINYITSYCSKKHSLEGYKQTGFIVFQSFTVYMFPQYPIAMPQISHLAI